MNQSSLVFSFSEPLADLPRSRRDDPESSHVAAEKIVRSLAQQQNRVLWHVRMNPGLTAVELAHRMAQNQPSDTPAWKDWRYYHDWTRRRLPELIAHVKKGPIRVCTKSHNKAHEWWPV